MKATKMTRKQATRYLLDFLARAVEEDAQCVYLQALATEDDETTLRDVIQAATRQVIAKAKAARCPA